MAGAVIHHRRGSGGVGLAVSVVSEIFSPSPSSLPVGYVTLSHLDGPDSHITTFEDMLSTSPPPPAARARRGGSGGGSFSGGSSRLSSMGIGDEGTGFP